MFKSFRPFAQAAVFTALLVLPGVDACAQALVADTALPAGTFSQTGEVKKISARPMRITIDRLVYDIAPNATLWIDGEASEVKPGLLGASWLGTKVSFSLFRDSADKLWLLDLSNRTAGSPVKIAAPSPRPPAGEGAPKGQEKERTARGVQRQ
jgi:hypothetical protein